MTYTGSPWLIALFGHSGSHAPQLMHSLVIIVAIIKTPCPNFFNYVFPEKLSIISAVVESRGKFMLAVFSKAAYPSG